MFIVAVEKGDYELASKYFVVERQKEWEDNLMEVKNYTVSDPIFINFIKHPPNLNSGSGNGVDAISINGTITQSGATTSPGGLW